MQLSTFSANKLLVLVFNILFSIRTWKVVFIIISLASMVGCYTLARKVYVVRCSAGGMFMTQQRCDDFAQADFYRSEYYRLTYNQ